MSKGYQYLFGPISSRRLGRSLGIDLTPLKTCSMNCVFCQLGDSAQAVNRRTEYVPTDHVIAELACWLKEDGVADHITLAGSGEPTLHTGFGSVLGWIKKNTSIPSVLLTNGSLLYLPAVRDAAALADKVKVTLSAWDEASFQQLHCPAKGSTFKQLVEGERAFRQQFSGELAVEVFVVAGINDTPAAMRRIGALIGDIGSDRIDVNTAVRPPADPSVRAVLPETLQELAEVLGPKASVTASFPHKTASRVDVFSEESVLRLVQRHPMTTKEISDAFNVPIEKADEQLKEWVLTGVLDTEKRGVEYYFFVR